MYLTVTTSHVIVASRDAFFVWQFRTAQSWTTHRLDSSKTSDTVKNSQNKSERLYHVDDTPGGSVLSATRTSGARRNSSAKSSESDQIVPTSDPICCITASDKILMVSRESGVVQRYALPNVALTNKYQIQTKAHKLALNCNST